jgi:hypothetical protein
MTIKKRAVLGIAVLASAAGALAPAQSAQAWEQCYAELDDGTQLCLGSSECNNINQRLEKVTGQRWECLQ